MKAIVLLFLVTSLPLFAQSGTVATPEKLAAVKAAHDGVANSGFVPPGTYLNKLSKEDQAAVKAFVDSVFRCAGKWPLSDRNYALIASGKRKPENTDRFEIDKLLKEEKISKEAHAAYSAKLDEALMREGVIRADIVLNHPAIIPALRCEQTYTQLQCDIAVKDLLSESGPSVSSR